MRAIALLALVALTALGGLFVLHREEVSREGIALTTLRALGLGRPTPQAAVSRTDRRAPARDELEEQPSAEEPVSADAGRDEPEFYQYLDDAGRVRFVQSLGDVPAQWRDSVGRVSLSPNRIVRTQTPTGSIPSWDPGAAAARPAEVVVYTAPWCGWCRKTLAWLDERDVDYQNKDIDANERWRMELVEKIGAAAVPLVEIDDQKIRGFSPERMSRALDPS